MRRMELELTERQYLALSGACGLYQETMQESGQSSLAIVNAWREIHQGWANGAPIKRRTRRIR